MIKLHEVICRILCGRSLIKTVNILLIPVSFLYCSKLEIIESDDGVTFTLFAQGETLGQMRQAIQSEECSILSGAIIALCEKTIIRLDEKEVGNHISKLTTL